MKKLASLVRVVGGGVAGLAVAALLSSRGQAADRVDSLALAASPMADIIDVYAWMAGVNLELVMNVSPQDNGSHSFDPSVLYVFHLTSKAGLGINTTGGTETKVICRFASNTSVQCWVVSATGTKDYVTGDPSNTAGVASIAGKLKVFAGRRSDPAFFNQSGFNTAIQTLKGLLGSAPDPAGCPAGIQASEAMSLRTALATGSDDFAASNVMSIVVQIDKSLINSPNNTVVAVWGSTHAGG